MRKLNKIQIVDLVISLVLVGGAIAAWGYIGFGKAAGLAFFIPYVIYEMACFAYAKVTGLFKKVDAELREHYRPEDYDETECED